MCKPQRVSVFIFSSHARFPELAINLPSGIAEFLTRDLLLAPSGSMDPCVSLPRSPWIKDPAEPVPLPQHLLLLAAVPGLPRSWWINLHPVIFKDGSRDLPP